MATPNAGNLIGLLTLVIIGFIIMGVLLHAKPASMALGTLFTGLTSTGAVLEGYPAGRGSGS